MTVKANIFGDVRAEADHSMLNTAFYESADYLSLIESTDRSIVVGRRGTGKSALCYKLSQYWKKQTKTRVLSLAPEEAQVIGLREIASLFGESFNQIKAGARIAWKYALLMEVITSLAQNYKFKETFDFTEFSSHLSRWDTRNSDISGNIRKVLRIVVDKDDTPGNRIADLATQLEIKSLESSLKEALQKCNYNIVILADRLDEGYEPDNVGVALVDGFVQALVDLSSHHDSIKATAFLRDNIFRAIAKIDPDYTRNLEGQVLRLHWDDQTLFYVITRRMRAVFANTTENDRRLWDRYTANDLKGMDGFRYCLRSTLYRPRDALALLNNAFFHAKRHQRERIVKEDIEQTATSISKDRLEDLTKEYDAIFPSIKTFVSAFSARTPEIKVEEAENLIRGVLEADNSPPKEQQDITIFQTPLEVIQQLYSVGFLGVKDSNKGVTIFCHDGRTPDKELTETQQLLVHPCYWMALNLNTQEAQISPEDIYDEYKIDVKSDESDVRNKRLGQLMAELDKIEAGRDHAGKFEQWALQAIKFIFAGSLRNIELHPNKDAIQRRDIVGTNLAETEFWSRVYNDYGTRQVIFEVKNFEDIELEEYRQLHSYLSGEYGKFAVFLTRKKDNKLTKKEIGWTKEFYDKHGVIIIKLSANFLKKMISKQRSPQKFNFANRELDKLLDMYIRDYLSARHAR